MKNIMMSVTRQGAINECRQAIAGKSCACGSGPTWGNPMPVVFDPDFYGHRKTIWYAGCGNRSHQGQFLGSPVSDAIYTRARGRLRKLSSIAALLDPE